MDSTKIADWLQIGGNVGIIAGLILVAVQINQNSEITELDMRSRSFELAMQSELAMMGENPAAAWSKASSGTDELTDDELTVIHGYLNFWWNHRERNALILNAGFLDATNYNENYTGDYIFGGNSAAIAWWMKMDPYNTEPWTDSVDRVIDEQPEGFNAILEPMRAVAN